MSHSSLRSVPNFLFPPPCTHHAKLLRIFIMGGTKAITMPNLLGDSRRNINLVIFRIFKFTLADICGSLKQ